MTDTYDPYDGEKAIEWYKHYMKIPAAEFVATYALDCHSKGEVTVAMEAAMEERREEIVSALVDGEL